jgi:hypothetical protein
MKRRISLLIAIFALTAYTVSAQFTLSGEYRPRYEFRNGYKKMPDANTTSANLVSQRTRLNIDWQWKRLKTKLSIQDVRVWGDEAMKKDIAGLGLYEGWVQLGITDSLFLRIGRQELVYDNQRLFSNNNWSQKGVTHDALLMQYHQKGWTLDVIGAFNQSRDTTFSTDYNINLGNYKALGVVMLSKRIWKLNITGLSVIDGYQRKNTTNTMYIRTTNGGIITFNAGPISGGLRGFYQSGQNETGNYINAYYGSLEVTGKIAKKISITGGCEFQSGQDSTDASDHQVHYFTTLYGSNHNHNGYLDYFTKPADTKNTGLLDAYLKLGYKIGKKVNLMGDLHYFSTTNKFPDRINGGNMDPFLAWETDLTCKVAFSKEIEMQLGYSALFADKTLQLFGGGSAAHYAHWAYVMLIIKPVFFHWDNQSK